MGSGIGLIGRIGGGGAKKIVFILDDSEVVLAAATAALEGCGLEVHAASNLAQLEEELVRARPDLLVLDVQMPEMFGDDVARVLREVRGMKVPVVLFSDLDESALADRARDAHVAAWVAKREGLPALLTRVDGLLGGA